MNKHTTIRRQIIAAVLLMIFSFSITPKKLLHDAIATHKDKIAASTDNSLQISNSGFACKCDSLVAESPFTNQDNHIEFSTTHYFTAHTEALTARFYSSCHFFIELRGPPVNNI